jgi:hypothetical protein
MLPPSLSLWFDRSLTMPSPSKFPSPPDERSIPSERTPSDENLRPTQLNTELHARIAKTGSARPSTYESAMKALQRVREQRGAAGS